MKKNLKKLETIETYRIEEFLYILKINKYLYIKFNSRNNLCYF